MALYITGGKTWDHKHEAWCPWKNEALARNDAKILRLPVIYKIKEWRKI